MARTRPRPLCPCASLHCLPRASQYSWTAKWPYHASNPEPPEGDALMVAVLAGLLSDSLSSLKVLVVGRLGPRMGKRRRCVPSITRPAICSTFSRHKATRPDGDLGYVSCSCVRTCRCDNFLDTESRPGGLRCRCNRSSQMLLRCLPVRPYPCHPARAST